MNYRKWSSALPTLVFLSGGTFSSARYNLRLTSTRQQHFAHQIEPTFSNEQFEEYNTHGVEETEEKGSSRLSTLSKTEIEGRLPIHSSLAVLSYII